MSVETTVLLGRDKMITPQQWQQAIDDAGMELSLGAEFDPIDHMGYLPCERRDGECGFEYFFSPLDRGEYAELGDRLSADWDSVVSFVTRSSTDDLAAATMAAGVLSASTGGGLLAAGEPPLIVGRDALAWARESLRSIDSEIDSIRDAEAVNDALGDDQDAIDRLFSETIAKLVGRPVEVTDGFGGIRIQIDEVVSLSLNAWELELPDGDLKTRLDRDSVDDPEEIYKHSERIANRLSSSIDNTIVAAARMLGTGVIELEFADGTDIRGVNDPHFVMPWTLIADRLRWFCDEEGINVCPY